MTYTQSLISQQPLPHQLVKDIHNVHDSLKSRRGSMTPDAFVNQTFNKLVATTRLPVHRRDIQTILGELDKDNILSSLHNLCAEGEFELEKYWAERICHAANPRLEMRNFPYWGNYLKLAKLEMKALRSVMPNVSSLLFAGSGPLPLSSYIFAAHYGLNITNIEMEEYAAHCSVAWMNPLLGTRKIPCHHMDILNFTAFEDFDVVLMAALVGLTPAEKKQIVAHLHTHMKPGQLLLVRSVKGLRKLLYPEVTARDLAGFEIIKEVHPRGEVVNSAIIAKRL